MFLCFVVPLFFILRVRDDLLKSGQLVVGRFVGRSLGGRLWSQTEGTGTGVVWNFG